MQVHGVAVQSEKFTGQNPENKSKSDKPPGLLYTDLLLESTFNIGFEIKMKILWATFEF